MDPFEELERMALNAAHEPELDDEVSSTDIARWQKLFSYTYEQAADLIQQQKHDYTRARISSEHWDTIRTRFEAQGYDQNAYEHELAMGGKRTGTAGLVQSSNLSAKDARATHVLKLEGPLCTPELVRVAAGLPKPPERVQGEGDDGEASFCCVDGSSKQAILMWLSVNAATFTPTFARVTQLSEKDLSATSIYPTLGIDSTLPQYRPSDLVGAFEPAQDQYPVWYFFYGNLADSAILTRRLRLQEAPVFHPATTTGGKMRRWGGKYNALVDGSAGSVVHGSAYHVMSKEHEDALRAYETDVYEVVRCAISIASQTGCLEVKGCAFRFVGTVDG